MSYLKEGVIIEQQFLAIDIGGTFIKYVTFNQQGSQLRATEKVATIISEASNQILAQVLEIVEAISSEVTLSGVAISTAGVVDAADGSIRYSGYTIPGYTGTPLKQTIEHHYQLPCAVINDVNAAAYGEYWQSFGENDKPKSLCCLTIGTGVGGAFVLDGQVYVGATGMAGEVGYLPFAEGLFQDLASTTALLKAAKQVDGKDLTGETFFQLLAEDANSGYQVVFDNFITALAQGILTVSYVMNPEVVILGGGILAQESIILPKLEASLKKQAIDERFVSAEIKAAKLGNNAGMLGALYYLLESGLDRG